MLNLTSGANGSLVMVTKEDSWKLDSSMFCVEGNWETGYIFDKDIFFMVGVTTYYKVGASVIVTAGFEPSTNRMEFALHYLSKAQEYVDCNDLVGANKAIKSAQYWIKA
jgi:hypothetical protein